MTENKLIQLGKISHFISQFFRYTVILILLTIIGVGTYGFGVLLGLIFFKFIQKLIPFNISVYNDFLKLSQQKLEVNDFKNKFGKKLIYNFLLFIFISSLAGGIPYLNNSEDKILFSILSGVFISFLLFQFYYFIVVNNYVRSNKESFSQNSISTDEEFIESENIKTSNNFENKVKNSTVKTLQFINNKNKLNWMKSLSQNEVIIVSLIIGAIIFLLLGYGFGDTERIYYNTQSSRGYSDRISYSSHKEDIFKFNYATAFAGFIISSGISYLLLNKIRK